MTFHTPTPVTPSVIQLVTKTSELFLVSRTSDSSWKALAGLVALYWAAALFYIAVTVVYRGSHHEQIHAMHSATALMLFWTSLPLAFASSAAVDRARDRNELVPSFALRARTAAWILIAVELASLAIILLAVAGR